MKTNRKRISLSRVVLFQVLTMFCCFLFASTIVFAAPSDDFVITVKTDNPGASSNTQFKIPTTNRDGETYNYNVDCNNDGTNEATGVTGDYTCNYTSLGGVGTYTVRIKDNTGTGTGFPRIYFYDYHGNSDSEKLLSVNQWGTGHWTSMAFAFYGCNKLNSATAINSGGGALPDWATDAPDLSNVTSMSFMFYNNWYFNQNISNWDVSNVTDMDGMFNAASSFNQDISGWNVSNVTNMWAMFSHAKKFNQDISDWNVSNVTNMFSMFQSASSFNQNLAGWDVSNVDNMTGMFSYSGMSADSYDDTLIGWSARSLQNGVQLDSSAHYCRSETQRQHIIDTYHWTVNDAGKSCVVQNIPVGKHIYTYLSVKNPVFNVDPESAKPFASGNIPGGTLNLRVGLKEFASPVDIYLAISYSGLPGDIFLIDSSKGFHKNTIAPWKTNHIAHINESLYGNINTSDLPEGTYTLYTLIVPAGATDMNNSYLWITGFNITH